MGRVAASRSLVGLTLGTGIGGVIAIDGHVHLGHDGTAGEIGHQIIDPDGPSCNCGNHGCLEAFARADRIAEACGTDTVEAAVAAAEAGDPRALDGLAAVGRYLGIGIGTEIETGLGRAGDCFRLTALLGVDAGDRRRPCRRTLSPACRKRSASSISRTALR